jgi:hypothetical protein
VEHWLSRSLECSCSNTSIELMIRRSTAQAVDHCAVAFCLSAATQSPELARGEAELSGSGGGRQKSVFNFSQHCESIALS